MFQFLFDLFKYNRILLKLKQFKKKIYRILAWNLRYLMDVGSRDRHFDNFMDLGQGKL